MMQLKVGGTGVGEGGYICYCVEAAGEISPHFSS